MTGAELIQIIQNNGLEDYEIVFFHEIGEGSYPVREAYINDAEKTIELC